MWFLAVPCYTARCLTTAKLPCLSQNMLSMTRTRPPSPTFEVHALRTKPFDLDVQTKPHCEPKVPGSTSMVRATPDGRVWMPCSKASRRVLYQKPLLLLCRYVDFNVLVQCTLGDPLSGFNRLRKSHISHSISSYTRVECVSCVKTMHLILFASDRRARCSFLNKHFQSLYSNTQ